MRLLDMLYVERSVTRAAERLFLTPSAVSHALRRLRRLFDDELFIRGAGGMIPTARAHEAAQHLKSLLPKLHEVIQTPRFDPAMSEKMFAVACVPYLTSIFVPGLAAALSRTAPNVGIDIRLLHDAMADDIESGALDLAFGNFRKVPRRLCVEELFRDAYVWVIGEGNPRAPAYLDTATIGALPHVELNLESAAPHPDENYDARQGLERLVIQNNLSTVDRALNKAGLARIARFKAPDSIAAMAIAARTDAVALIPSRAAATFARRFGLAVHPSPFPVEPLVIQMLYHRDLTARPATSWLLDQVRSGVASFLLEGDGSRDREVSSP
nr:LysR family transcriptional regulator [Sphingomonas chungangi]